MLEYLNFCLLCAIFTSILYLYSRVKRYLSLFKMAEETSSSPQSDTNIREIHYHKENKTNRGKQIEFSAESNQFEKKSKVGINEMFSNC